MFKSLAAFLVFACSLSVPFAALPKGSDGFVILHGRLEESNVSEHAVNFLFTGEFSFTLLTAPPDNPGSRKIEQKFAVNRLAVRIPWWEPNPVPGIEGPWVVNFENASRHVTHVTRTREVVTVVLFRPIISYDIYGAMTLVGCTHAQVMPDLGPPVTVKRP